MNTFVSIRLPDGTPRKRPLIVIHCTAINVENLARVADSEKETTLPDGQAKLLKFAELDLMCITDLIAFAAFYRWNEEWHKAYKKDRQLNRKKGAKALARFLKQHGL